MKRTTNSFVRRADPVLMTQAQNIIQKMNENEFFPSPHPTLPTVTAALDTFVTSVAVAKSGDREDIAQKNANKQSLASLLTQLGFYVSMTANGNEVKLISSGFPFTKSAQPQGPVTAVTELQVLVDNLNTGEAQLKFKKAQSAKSYIYQYTTDPLLGEENWKSINGTISRYLFTGLESGKRYWFRVVSVGIDEQTKYSDVVTKVIQ